MYDSWQAKPIDVTSSNATDINLRLALGRVLSGRVTTEEGAALENTKITVYHHQPAGSRARIVYTDSAGYYYFSGLGPGTYKVCTEAGRGYLDEWYDDLIKLLHTEDKATIVDMNGADATNINFVLARGKTISGKITKADGTPLAGVHVYARSPDTGYAVRSTTLPSRADGSYVIDGLLPGKYAVSTSNDLGYVDEWYDNLPWVLHSVAEAKLVDVTATNAGKINFSLVVGKSISGRVTQEGGAAIPAADLGGIDIWVWTPAGDKLVGLDSTLADDGGYSVIGLPAGKWAVRTSNYKGYANEWYNNLPMAFYTAAQSTHVNVTAANASNIDFALAKRRKISGSVRAAGGAGLADVEVRLFSLAGKQLTTTKSQGSDGAYAFGSAVAGIPAGKYKLRTMAGSAYVDEWFNDLPVFAYTVAEASLVDVTAADQTSIAFVLSKNQAPSLGSFSPTPITVKAGQTQLYSALFTDQNGARQLKEVSLLFNTSAVPAGGVYLKYDENANQLKLLAEDGTTWLAAAPGSTTPLQNSRVVLKPDLSSVTKSGTGLTLKVSLAFKSTFLGTKNAYLSVLDDGGLALAWQNKGQVTVTAP